MGFLYLFPGGVIGLRAAELLQQFTNCAIGLPHCLDGTTGKECRGPLP